MPEARQYAGETRVDIKVGVAPEIVVLSVFESRLGGGGDTEKTMYGLIDPGDTKKRTVEADDIAGARFFYPTPIPTPTPELTPTAYPPGWAAAHGWTIYE